MARYNPKAKGKEKNKTGLSGQRIGSAPWQATYGMSLTGMEYVDEMKLVAKEMEDRWGVGRLRLLVPIDLREKFDRQRYLTNQAIWLGDLEQLKTHTRKMMVAYRKLDEVAQASGASRKPVEQWETVLGDGTVLVVVKAPEDAQGVSDDGRKKVVWSLEEVAMLVDEQKAILLAKALFAGAEVIKVETSIKDPLDSFSTSLAGLDDELSDIPMFDPLMG